MADEIDRKLIPELFQTAFTLSLGATYRGLEMMKTPQQSAGKMWTEMKELATIPSDAGEGVREKLKALAAVWMEKGASWMELCRTTGNEFTEDEKRS